MDLISHSAPYQDGLRHLPTVTDGDSGDIVQVRLYYLVISRSLLRTYRSADLWHVGESAFKLSL